MTMTMTMSRPARHLNDMMNGNEMHTILTRLSLATPCAALSARISLI